MRKNEQPQFNAELNELLQKYRIKVLCGFYISKFGAGEQNGMAAGGLNPGKPGFQKLMAISPRMLQLMEETEPFFKNV